MKLKNKKSGIIADLSDEADISNDGISIVLYCGDEVYCYSSLAELSKEWIDVPEEPKRINEIDVVLEAIDEYCNVLSYYSGDLEKIKTLNIIEDKLKAWQRLKDLDTEILGWEIRDMPDGGNWQTVNVKLNIKARKEPMELLDLLFEGEE